MDEKILTAKKVAELREIAKAFNIAGYQKLRKAELIKALTDTEYARTGAEKTETEPACDGDSVVKKKKPTETKKENEEDRPLDADDEKIGEKTVTRKAAEKKAGENKKTDKDDLGNGKDDKALTEGKNTGRKNGTRGDRKKTGGRNESNEKDGKEPVAEESDGKDKKNEIQQEDRPEVEGILELAEGGFGFLRFSNFLTSTEDIYVSPTQIRRFNLKTGDKINGISRRPNEGEKFGALLYVNTVNGDEPGVSMKRPEFEELTPVFPNERITLEGASRELSMRLIDLVAPIGKGQRGLIVAPPKAGKTTLLKQIANSIERSHPEIEMIVLLVDERPEEVTDMKRSLHGGDVIYSTFDEMPQHHVKVAKMVLSRAQRLVEHGKDVVILLDSITRLARAYNLVVSPSGRTLSGGLKKATKECL